MGTVTIFRNSSPQANTSGGFFYGFRSLPIFCRESGTVVNLYLWIVRRINLHLPEKRRTIDWGFQII